MKIHVLLSPLNAEELYFTGKTTVVIDVLRATSSIVTAIENGAKEITPIGSVEFALKASGSKVLLGGERNTNKIEGFNLGNSPFEYSRENVENKSIIFFTTNGSKAIVKAKFSENLFLCSFRNIKAVAEKLSNINKDITILCAGSEGMFCLEDTVCAGKLIDQISKQNNDIEISDAGKASKVLSDTYGSDLKKMLTESEHGKKLIDNGYHEDIVFCSELNTSDVVPSFKSGVIKIDKSS